MHGLAATIPCEDVAMDEELSLGWDEARELNVSAGLKGHQDALMKADTSALLVLGELGISVCLYLVFL